jgi:hypothetical protein
LRATFIVISLTAKSWYLLRVITTVWTLNGTWHQKHVVWPSLYQFSQYNTFATPMSLTESRMEMQPNQLEASPSKAPTQPEDSQPKTSSSKGPTQIKDSQPKASSSKVPTPPKDSQQKASSSKGPTSPKDSQPKASSRKGPTQSKDSGRKGLPSLALSETYQLLEPWYLFQQSALR